MTEYLLSLHGIRENTKDDYLSKVKMLGTFLTKHGVMRFEDANSRDIDLFLSRYNNENTLNVYACARDTHIVAWVYLRSHNEALKKWFVLQCIKESSTLRVSPKGAKAPPRIVYRHGEQDGQIQEFLQYRRRIKRIIGKLSTSCMHAHACCRYAYVMPRIVWPDSI